MASNLFSGDFMGQAVKVEVGIKKGKKIVRIDMQVSDDGEHKGRRVSYEGKLDDDNIKYTKRAMLAVGWQGKTVATFESDVATAKLTVPFSVEIAEWNPGDGRDIMRWSTVKRIGGAAAPLETLSKDDVKNVDKWFEQAGDVGAAPALNGVKRDDSDLPF